MDNTYYIKNIKIETSFDEKSANSFKTKECNLLIKDKIIEKILDKNENFDEKYKVMDAKGLLMVPSFREKHCHIDKTYLGDKWFAALEKGTVLERGKHEMEVLSKMKDTTMDFRSKKLIDLFIENGSTFIRTHVDIYPEVGLDHLNSVKASLDSYADKIDYEIVAFPQHGLLKGNTVDLLEKALETASHVGGVDPTEIDTDVDKSLGTTFSLAVNADKNIDYHLHERFEKGLNVVNKIADLTEKHHLEGRVSISHAFALRDIKGNERDELCERLKALDIEVISSIPLNDNSPDVYYYYKKGLKIALANDNIFDSWSSLGNGSLLERLNRYCEVYALKSEKNLADSLNLITGYKNNLDYDGKYCWPKTGDKANFLFVNSGSRAEFVARRSEIIAVFNNGICLKGAKNL